MMKPTTHQRRRTSRILLGVIITWTISIILGCGWLAFKGVAGPHRPDPTTGRVIEIHAVPVRGVHFYGTRMEVQLVWLFNGAFVVFLLVVLAMYAWQKGLGRADRIWTPRKF